jgi:hypothetical protein
MTDSAWKITEALSVAKSTLLDIRNNPVAMAVLNACSAGGDPEVSLGSKVRCALDEEGMRMVR